ncbi:MAG: hypothetical protein ACFFCO_06225 [Promethearchaeota archaeon]
MADIVFQSEFLNMQKCLAIFYVKLIIKNVYVSQLGTEPSLKLGTALFSFKLNFGSEATGFCSFLKSVCP